jgi:hypothetical protein
MGRMQEYALRSIGVESIMDSMRSAEYDGSVVITVMGRRELAKGFCDRRDRDPGKGLLTAGRWSMPRWRCVVGRLTARVGCLDHLGEWNLRMEGRLFGGAA